MTSSRVFSCTPADLTLGMANWSSRSLRRGLSFSEAWRLASSRKLPSTPGLVRTSEGLGRPGAGFSFWTEKQRVALDGQYLRHNSKVPWYDWGVSFDQSSRTQRARTSCWSLDTSFRTSPEQWLREEAHSKGDYVDFWAIKQPQTWTLKSPPRSPSPDRWAQLQSQRHGCPVPVPPPLAFEAGSRSPFTVAHPEWGRGGFSIGRSQRMVQEPTFRRSRSYSPIPTR